MIFRQDQVDGSDAGTALQSSLEYNQEVRRQAVTNIQAALIDFGRSRGLNKTQIEGYVNSLFSTFSAEWFLYLLIGSSDLATAIQNDATLPWLDIDVGGQTLRQRLVARLS